MLRLLAFAGILYGLVWLSVIVPQLAIAVAAAIQ